MKELHLKRWVKVTLGIMTVIVVIGLMKALYLFNESEVRNCMSYGHSEAYCRSAK